MIWKNEQIIEYLTALAQATVLGSQFYEMEIIFSYEDRIVEVCCHSKIKNQGFSIAFARVTIERSAESSSLIPFPKLFKFHLKHLGVSTK